MQTNVIISWLFLSEEEDCKASSIVKLDALGRASVRISTG